MKKISDKKKKKVQLTWFELQEQKNQSPSPKGVRTQQSADLSFFD